MQAVILAGGAGTRLRPLTLSTPKPMIDINGRPFLSYIVDVLKRYGITELVFCIGYLSEKFKEYFGDGSKFGVNIKYTFEKEFFGTAGAIKLAEEHLKNDFFVLNGDTYLDVDYKKVYDAFKKANTLGLMVVYDNAENIAEENIAIDDKGIIISYGKKETLKKGDKLVKVKVPKGIKFKYIDSGVYVFKREIVNMIKDNEFVSLEGDIYPDLIRKKQLMSYATSNRYYDLGTPERLELIRTVLK